MENNTRNYAAHGGNEWVIGGKLTFLPGAEVEGPIENQADSTASTVAGLKDDLNALLAKLKASGLMLSDAPGA